MSSQQLAIRTMTQIEIAWAADWAAKEGWNPGIHDAEVYAAVFPQDFLIGMLDDEPVGVISAVRYDDTFGFLGFYIVRPEYRGLGCGMQLWQAGMKHLEGCNVGLDGVTEQQENYRKSGFRLAYQNKRYKTFGVSPVTGQESAAFPEVVQLSSLPAGLLEEYIHPFFPSERAKFNRLWNSQADSHALGYIKNGAVAGFGLMRQCRAGYKIGPLYADNADVAEVLFQALRAKVSSDEEIYLDVPEVNEAALNLAGRHNMEVTFSAARMYTGEIPDTDLDRVFGVTSFEVG